MKRALIKRLSGVLEIPVYDGAVQAELLIPSVVVLPTEYRVEKAMPDGAEAVAHVKLAYRGEDEMIPLVLFALTSLPSGERAYRGENITAEQERDVTLLRADYRVRVSVSETADAPMMEQMDLHQEEDR